MHKQRCPKCGSTNLMVYDEDLNIIKCNDCGYDELEHEPVSYDIKKNTQKGNFNPYKTGGSRRAQKK